MPATVCAAASVLLGPPRIAKLIAIIAEDMGIEFVMPAA
jgi:hypothetical protein